MPDNGAPAHLSSVCLFCDQAPCACPAPPRTGTLALSWGPWGGVYLHRGFAWRLCLGWLALTYVPVELDDLMEAYADA